MTITRADVESLLAQVAPPTGGSLALEIFAELCRCWLAVDDAPSGETLLCTSDRTATPEWITTLKTNDYIPAGTYKLVCIETPTGGRE